MFTEYASEQEIYNILCALNPRKSPGIDNIRSIDLKNNANVLTPIITKLVNDSIHNAIIPDLMKQSLIKPIHKSGNKSDYNNYRPIAILPVIEKVLEEIVARRLNSFLKKYKVINKEQYGFQKGKNINQLLGLFANNINTSLSQNKNCLALFIDFSKAFDTLPHEKLLNVLEKVGIRGKILNWFANYLTCRSFCVNIGDTKSSIMPSEFGVPQGSKLGPILYIIYANEMILQLKYSTAYTYADDTAIIVSNKSLNDAVCSLQYDLNKVTRWCHDSGLIINAKKTKVMHIRPRSVPKTTFRITFHNTECLHKKDIVFNQSQNDNCDSHLEIVETYKYLGVHLDDNFKWKSHIHHVQTKLRQSSYALYHLGNCAPYYVIKQAYFSLVESHLRHGITAWGNAKICSVLQSAQNKIVKSLSKKQPASTQHRTNNNRPTTQLYATQKILNIKDLYSISIIKEFMEDANLAKKLNHEQNTRRRIEGRYIVPAFKNDYGKHALSVSLPTILNELPNAIMQECNKKIRIKLLKNHYLNK